MSASSSASASPSTNETTVSGIVPVIAPETIGHSDEENSSQDVSLMGPASCGSR
jgi:hypothetical protein